MLKLICLITALTFSGVVYAQPVTVQSDASVAVQPASMATATTAQPTAGSATTQPILPTAPDAMQPGEQVVVKVEQSKPIWKSSAFWIGVVGGPMLSIILAVLLAFGVISRKQMDWLKQNKIIEIADKVVTQFEKFAADTSVKWDDALAHALRAVVDRVGALSEGEEALVKKVVDGRIKQAEAKADGKSAVDEKPTEEKKEEEPKKD